MTGIPKDFIPLFVIGEIDGAIHVYTKLTNDESCDLLEDVLESISFDGFNEEVVTLQ